MYNMNVYSGKDRKRTTPSMTATDATVTRLTAKTDKCGTQIVYAQLISSTI
jgi:hypothetical protein